MEASTLSENALGHEAEAQLFSLGNQECLGGSRSIPFLSSKLFKLL